MSKASPGWTMRWLMACAIMIGAAAHALPSEFNFSAYVDTSYHYLVKNHQFISTKNDRVNDLAQNGFTLQQAAFTASLLPNDGFGGLLNVMVGRDANTIAPYGWNPYYGSQTLAMVVPNAYLQYGRGPLALQGGIFETRVGYESFDSTRDSNFSRSILDGYAEPGMFLGMRALYQLTDAIKLNFSVNNGWSGLRDYGRGRTIEAGAVYQMNRTVALMLQTITGNQRLVTRTVSGPLGRRNLINLIATWQATDRLMLVASGDYATQNKALASNGHISSVEWDGLSAYVNYQFNERWRSSLRGEWYADQNGYTTAVHQNWRELTVTVAYLPIKQFELRAETRRDFSNKRAFMNETGPGAAFYQQSFGLEGVYTFDK